MKKVLPYLNTNLSFKKRVADLVSRLTLDEKIGLLPHFQQAIPRFNINKLGFGTEVARGFLSREEGEISTVFPQPIGLAATFNPQLMHDLGEICGIETRIYNNKYDYEKLMVWGPTVDLCRHPLWGRNEESYGEDPFLTGELSTAYTSGMRGSDKKYLRVLSGLKHFCCNNHEENRNRDNANIDARLLREYYYAAFEPAIKAKAAHSVMTAYNELSGVPAMVNTDVKNVCKKEWGMLFAVTDGGDFSQNVTEHNYSESHAETVALAIKAGNNIMTDNYEAVAVTAGKAAIKRRLLTEKELDAAISEVLLGRFMLGEFDPPELNPFSNVSEEQLNCDEFRKATAQAARECITLLKNESGMLPFKDDGKCTVAVVGQLGESAYKDWYTGMSAYNTTIAGGLRKLLGESRVKFCDACDIIAIKSAQNGKYLQVKEDGSVIADSDTITEAAKFKAIDTAHGPMVYISVLNGKLLRCEESDRGVIDGDAPVGYVNAVGKDTYEWFGRMIFNKTSIKENVGSSLVMYKNWRGKCIAVDEHGRLCETEFSVAAAAKRFEEVVVESGVEKAKKLAEQADYTVICVGNDPMVEARECLDRKTLDLSVAQAELINATAKVKNRVLVITSSYPYAFCEKNLPAVIHTAHGGPEAGGAMADVLFGGYNPSGRLPQTWYKCTHDLPDIKNYDIRQTKSTYLYYEGEPLYPFGHGLSYSSFEYSDFNVKENDNEIEVTLKVRNTSDVYGEEVVQIYFTALEPRVKRPRIQLCEFIRRGFEPDETIEFSFVFDKARLRYWDVTRHKFAVETGGYRFYAGSSSKDIRLSCDVNINGEKIPPRNMSKPTAAVDYDDKRAVEMRYDKKRQRHYLHAPNWNGAIDFYDVDLSKASGIEVAVSTSISPGKVAVLVKDKLIGEIDISASPAPTEFKKYRCEFKKPLSGKGKLTLKLTEYLNILDIKLLY